MILDKLIYNEKYEVIDTAMSDSNIGGRKNRNIRNHIFILNGILNSVKQGESDSIDLQIFDLKKCFDSLWLQDTLNDMYETGFQDEKLALIYETNKITQVAVNTPCGQTDRVKVEEAVAQGGVWGPVQCAVSVDLIGKDSLQRSQDSENAKQKFAYWYKDTVPILPLGMIDDLAA